MMVPLKGQICTVETIIFPGFFHAQPGNNPDKNVINAGSGPDFMT